MKVFDGGSCVKDQDSTFITTTFRKSLPPTLSAYRERKEKSGRTRDLGSARALSPLHARQVTN